MCTCALVAISTHQCTYCIASWSCHGDTLEGGAAAHRLLHSNLGSSCAKHKTVPCCSNIHRAWWGNGENRDWEGVWMMRWHLRIWWGNVMKLLPAPLAHVRLRATDPLVQHGTHAVACPTCLCIAVCRCSTQVIHWSKFCTSSLLLITNPKYGSRGQLTVKLLMILYM